MEGNFKMNCLNFFVKKMGLCIIFLHLELLNEIEL